MRGFQLFLAALLALSAVGCGPFGGTGYKKANGQWAYVTWNAAVGTQVHPMNADDRTFKVLAKEFAKDSQSAYYQDQPIVGADPTTFELMRVSDYLRYSKDRNSVYIYSQRIPGADPKSFRHLKGLYSRDEHRPYCGGVPMAVADVDRFEVVRADGSESELYDKEMIQSFCGEACQGIEVSRQRPLAVGNGCWARDGVNYYHGPVRVEGADYESFVIEGDYQAHDKNRKYWGTRPDERAGGNQ